MTALVPFAPLLVLLALGGQQDPAASTAGRRHAVVVGVGSVHADVARRIGTTLERCPGYAADRIEVLAGDVEAPAVAVESIRLALERLEERTSAADGALVVLLGATEVSGDEVLLRVSRRDAFALRWLGPTLTSLAAGEVALVLDVAPPGSAEDASTHVERIAATLGIPVLLSCSAGEVSHPGEADDGPFQRSLTGALSGSADTDRDGSIDLGELFEHVGWELTLWGLEHDASQTPVLVPESAASTAVTGPVRPGSREPTRSDEPIRDVTETRPVETPPPPPAPEPVAPEPVAPEPVETETTETPAVDTPPAEPPTTDVRGVEEPPGDRLALERTLGLKLGRVTDEIADFYEVPEGRGAIVLGLTPGGPAERAGVEPFDILLTIDGAPLASLRRLPDADSVTLGLQRGWERLDVAVSPTGGAGAPTLGLMVRSTQPARGEPGLGVLVLAVQPDGPGDRAGFEVGDVLFSLDDTPLASPAHLFELVARVRPGERVPFERLRPTRGGRERRDRGELRPVARDEAGRLWAWTSAVELTWGVRVHPLDDRHAAELGLAPGAGLRVAFVHRPSPAEDAWLEVGDVLLQVDGREARALSSFVEPPRRESVLLDVNRNGRTHRVDMRRNP
jgi:S1-C subfamily serine protease